ncbi:MAG TPA: Mur ligase family protein [Oceanipulchritudo sp.]|nr:Mur ligase family protein [Oceanipulchritudo sp.]
MRVYFMSICGTGMGNGALLMRALGHEVMGADQNTYPPMSDRLKEKGIEVLPGYDAARLEALDPDLVVVGNVNTRGNPEVEWLLEHRSIPFVSLPQVLSEEILSGRRTVVVAGTHGKTTTTALAAMLLDRAGFNPGYLIGGVPLDLPSGAHTGNSAAPFVIEGDEYDSAFFDKRSKFIHYCPHILILGNLEFDHADIFRDLEDVKRAFSHLIKLVPASGRILVNSDDSTLESLLDIDWAPIFRVGLGDRADLQIVDYEAGEEGSSCSLYYHGRFWTRLELQLGGLHNVRNAAMAGLASAFAAGHADPCSFDLSHLSQFTGVKRRQEILFKGDRLLILYDFGHHPTALRATLESLRQRYPGRHLVMAFEARSNTACRKVHESAFELAFDLADEVHLGEVFRPERYGAGDRIDLEAMARRLGEKARAHASNRNLQQCLEEQLGILREPTVIVFFSNGSFEGIPGEIASRAREQERGDSSALTV